LKTIYAGLSGLELDAESFDLREGIILRRTYACLFAPFMAAFARPESGKHHPGPWKATRGGFSFEITAELLVPVETTEQYFELSRGAVRTIVFLLRLGVNPATLVPLVSSHSFSSIRDSTDEDVRLQPFEVQPRRFPLGVNGGIATEEAVAWVREHWQVTDRLLNESSEFALAVEALDAGQFIQNTALTFVSLWGALEALFSPSTSELRFRISLLLAAFLEPLGERRENRQKELLKLYDMRSAAAHGKPKHQPEHLLQTFNLLREVVLKIIDRGSVPTSSELNSMLFGL